MPLSKSPTGALLEIIGGIALGGGVIYAVLNFSEPGQIWMGAALFFSGAIVLGLGALIGK